MKNLTTLLAFLFLALAVQGQTIDLQKTYALPVFASQALNATYSAAQAQTKYPNFWTWIKYKGATDAEAMTVNEVAAAWNDAVWQTDGYVAGNKNSAYPQNGCQSRAVIDASGIYYAATNVPLTLAHGQYFGGGTGNATETGSANGGPGATGGTQIAIDHAHWLTRIFPDRNAMQSASWGDESNYGYSESFVVRGFRLSGGWEGKVHDPSFQSSGIAIWDSGETSRIEYCFSNEFNDAGIHNVRGTPTIIDGCSTFSNRRYGIWLDGGSLNTIAIYSPSGDDNGPGDGTPGALIGGTEGYGRAAGGTIAIVGNKAETNNVQGRKHGDQRFLDLQAGAWNVTVTSAWVFASTPLPECMAVDFGTYNGQIDVRGLKYTGFSGALKLTARGKTTLYNGPGNYIPVSFVANETGIVSATRDMGQGGTTPTLPPCTWTTGAWSAWSACKDGQQSRTRTVTAGTSTGCTPTPAPASSETQACGTTPVPCVWAAGPWSAWGPCVNGQQTRTRNVTSTGDCSGESGPGTSESQACTTPPSGTIPPRSAWKLTASHNSATYPLSNLVDGSITSRWTTEKKQDGTEWIIVDLGTTAPVSKVTMNAGGSYYDCPVAYTVQTSTDDTNWTTKATGKGNVNSRSPIVATFANATARYVRILQTGTNTANWWTMMELTIE